MVIVEYTAKMLAAHHPGATCSSCGRRVRPAADQRWAEVSGRLYCPACFAKKRHVFCPGGCPID